ncbi:MAG: type II toxin-antitoxin system RelE/ParE family toxin [Nitrospirota bacterium]|nr:type II toxin-antitoxin system RelE/ParE family toxin [Nitrospirota bacterium]
MHEIRITPQAEEDLRQLTRADRRLADRILTKLETLAEHPYQGKSLVGQHAGRRSLRVGTYRLIYRIDESTRRIILLTAKHRRHVY